MGRLHRFGPTVSAAFLLGIVLGGGAAYLVLKPHQPETVPAVVESESQAPSQPVSVASPPPRQEAGAVNPAALPSGQPIDVQQIRAQIAEIDTELRTTSQQSQEDQSAQLSALRQSIEQQQAQVAAIETQMQTSPEQLNAQQNSQVQRQNQQTALLQAQLSQLQSQINQQQQVVALREQQLANVVAPDGSDVITYYQDQANDAKQKLDTLKSDYQTLLQQQSQVIDQNYATQTNQIQNQQAGTVDLALQDAQAKNQLEQLNEQYQQLLSQQSSTSSQVQKLRSEREGLVERLQQATADSKVNAG